MYARYHTRLCAPGMASIIHCLRLYCFLTERASRVRVLACLLRLVTHCLRLYCFSTERASRVRLLACLLRPVGVCHRSSGMQASAIAASMDA